MNIDEFRLMEIHKVYPHWQPTSRFNESAQIFALYSRLNNQVKNEQIKGQTKMFKPERKQKMDQMSLFD